ncbi:MAG: pilin [Patescibacteria group bacterium]
MKKIFFGILLLCSLLPAMAQAQPAPTSTCACYCKTSGGAEPIDDAKTEPACREACDEKANYVYLGCFKNEASIPENNLLCWRKDDCEQTIADDTPTWGQLLDGQSATLEWGGQKPECPRGKGYCYNPPQKIQLGVQIGTLTEVGDLGSYVNAIYGFLLPAGALIAVVLLMVGGLQWAVAAGSPEKVKKAKERIVKALGGLVILFGAYSIAFLIDPRLTKFDALRIPMIQQIIFVDEGMDCDSLDADVNIEVTPDNGKSSLDVVCGDTGTVHLLGQTKAINVTEGQSCTYTSCGNAGDKCTQIPSTDPNVQGTWECMSCTDVFDGSTFAITPSDSVCSGLIDATEASTLAQQTGSHRYCEFYNAAWNAFGLDGGGWQVDGCVHIEYPKEETFINCAALKQDALDGGSLSCRAYDLVYATNREQSSEIDNFAGDDREFPLLTNICEEDPCGFAQLGGCRSMIFNATILTATTRADCIDQGFYNEVVSNAEAVPGSSAGNIHYQDKGSWDMVDYLVTPVTGERVDGTVGVVDFNPTW